MRYTNRYMLAVRQVQSESEGPFLAKHWLNRNTNAT